jgi:hypothetical protein
MNAGLRPVAAPRGCATGPLTTVHHERRCHAGGQPPGRQRAASAVSSDGGVLDERTGDILEDWTYWRESRLGGNVAGSPHLCQEAPDRIVPGTRRVRLVELRSVIRRRLSKTIVDEWWLVYCQRRDGEPVSRSLEGEVPAGGHTKHDTLVGELSQPASLLASPSGWSGIAPTTLGCWMRPRRRGASR